MTTFRRVAVQRYNSSLLILLIFLIVAFIADVRVTAAAAAAASATSTSSRRDNTIILHQQQNGMTEAARTTFLVRGGGAAARPKLASSQHILPSTSSTIINTNTIPTNDLKTKTLNTLLQTSFLIAASVSMVMFSPLPSITRHLAANDSNNNFKPSSSLLPQHPEQRAIQILSILSSTSASVELLLSPFVGSLVDSPLLGRKRCSVILHACIACANLCVVLRPGVMSICISRMVNVVAGGFLVIVTNTVIADVFAPPSSSSSSSPTLTNSRKNISTMSSSSLSSSQTSRNDTTSSSNTSEKMGSVLGKQAAYASLGFLLGSVVGGRLTEYGERVAYGTAMLLSIMATANVSFRMEESLEFGKSRRSKDDSEEVDDVVLPSLKDGYWEKPLSSVRLFYQYGSHMRTLALLLLLQSAPMFMGDVFQMFAKEEWSLHPKDFSNLVALFGILSIISNVSVPFIIQSLGVRTLSLLAIASSLIFPLTTIFTHSYRHVLAAACLGMLAGVQKLGTSAAMTSLASDLGVPQGRLQGEKASMLALLKIACPVVYGMLYLKGSAWKNGSVVGMADGDAVVWLNAIMSKVGRKLPFVLNVLLGICAFGVSWQNL